MNIDLIPVELSKLRGGDLVYDIDGDRYRLYGDPFQVNGRWVCDSTSDDYAVILSEDMQLFIKPQHIRRLD